MGEPGALAVTDERSKNWHHFFVPGGLPAMQRASLEMAEPEEIHFNRRLVDIGVGWSRSWRAGYSAQTGGRRPVGFEEFDAVIFAGTASDATGLEGLRAAFTPVQLKALTSVSYDHRLCIALILKDDLASAVRDLHHGRAEVAFVSGPIALISRQEVKGRCTPGQDAPFAVVIHSTPAFAAKNLQNAKRSNKAPSELGKQHLLESFADLLKLNTQSLHSKVIDSKIVHWRQCQVRKPFPESLTSSPCLAAGAASHLFLAGDFLACEATAGSFEGCIESAEAVAYAACVSLFGKADASDEGRLDDAMARCGRWRAASTNEVAQEIPSPKNATQNRCKGKDPIGGAIANLSRPQGRRWVRQAANDDRLQGA